MVFLEEFDSWAGGTIPIDYDSLGNTSWFATGLAYYFGARHHTGSFSPEYLSDMNGAKHTYFTEILPNHNKSLVWLGEHPYDDGVDIHGFVYIKGALVSYLLDKKLSELGFNLGYLMRYLYLNYGLSQTGITNQDILQALNTVTGDDFTQFFDDYVYDTTTLPLPEGDLEYIPHYFLELSTNQAAYKAGDTLVLRLDFANPESAFRADFFLGLTAPDGSIYFFDRTMRPVEANASDPTTYTPLVEDALFLAGQTYLDRELLSVVLPAIPAGQYTFFAALTKPGSVKAGKPEIIRMSIKPATMK